MLSPLSKAKVKQSKQHKYSIANHANHWNHDMPFYFLESVVQQQATTLETQCLVKDWNTLPRSRSKQALCHFIQHGFYAASNHIRCNYIYALQLSWNSDIVVPIHLSDLYHLHRSHVISQSKVVKKYRVDKRRSFYADRLSFCRTYQSPLGLLLERYGWKDSSLYNSYDFDIEYCDYHNCECQRSHQEILALEGET